MSAAAAAGHDAWRVIARVNCCLFAALPCFAVAGPPFRTDDPVVVEYGHYEIIPYTTQTLAAGGRSGVLPGVELHYGAVENMELDVVLPLAFNTPPGGSTRRGYGDTELGIKYRIVDEKEWIPLLSLVPLLDLATGNASRGLGSGGSAAFLGAAAQKSWGDLQSYASAGYWINNGSGNRDYWFVGWQAQYQISDHWVLGAEVFHMTAQTVDQGPSTGFNVGGYYIVDGHSQFLFSAGKGLQNAAQTNRVSSYFGYQYSF